MSETIPTQTSHLAESAHAQRKRAVTAVAALLLSAGLAAGCGEGNVSADGSATPTHSALAPTTSSTSLGPETPGAAPPTEAAPSPTASPDDSTLYKPTPGDAFSCNSSNFSTTQNSDGTITLELDLHGSAPNIANYYTYVDEMHNGQAEWRLLSGVHKTVTMLKSAIDPHSSWVGVINPADWPASARPTGPGYLSTDESANALIGYRTYLCGIVLTDGTADIPRW